MDAGHVNKFGLWECERCGFSFAQIHTDEGGGYTCPACALEREKRKRDDLTAVDDARRALEAAQGDCAAMRTAVESWMRDVEITVPHHPELVNGSRFKTAIASTAGRDLLERHKRELAERDARIVALERLLDSYSPMDKRCMDALADEVAALVRRGVIDSRSPAADALLDYRNPPSTEKADALAARDAELAQLREQREKRKRDDLTAVDDARRALEAAQGDCAAMREALKHDRHYRLVDQDETETYDFEPTCKKCQALASTAGRDLLERHARELAAKEDHIDRINMVVDNFESAVAAYEKDLAGRDAELAQLRERCERLERLIESATRSEAVSGDVKIPVRILFEGTIDDALSPGAPPATKESKK